MIHEIRLQMSIRVYESTTYSKKIDKNFYKEATNLKNKNTGMFHATVAEKLCTLYS